MGKAFSDLRTRHFALLNIVVFASIFAGRIARDALLFTRPGAELWLGGVLVVSAVLVAYVGTCLGDWIARVGLRRLTRITSLVVGPSIALLGAALYSGLYAPTWVVALVYIVTEVSSFIWLNAVWLQADEYYRDREKDLHYSSISGAGLLGISVGSAFALSVPLNVLFVVWGIATVVLGVQIAVLARKLPVQTLTVGPNTVAPLSEPAAPAGLQAQFKQAREDFRWAMRVPYVRFFTWVTIGNFLLIAIFDQSVARGASALSFNEEDVQLYMSYGLIAMGLISAGFQQFVFPRLLERIGIARLNLYAPSLMVVAVVVVLLFCTLSVGGFLRPLVAGSMVQPQTLFFFGLVGARIVAWTAEFLFNQSLLPFVYGAMPAADSQRARFFIEGPVMAVTNAGAGLFLLGYFAVTDHLEAMGAAQQGAPMLSQRIDFVGAQIDFLIILCIAAAGAMWWWSKLLIPQFRDVLLRRIRETGGGADLGPQYAVDMQFAIDEGREGAVSLDEPNDAVSVYLLARSANRQQAIVALARAARDEQTPPHVRGLAIRQLASVGAHDEIDAILSQWLCKERPPVEALIQAIGDVAETTGRLADLIESHHRWISLADRAQGRALLANLRRCGYRGHAIIGNHLSRLREDWQRAWPPNDLLAVSAELGADELMDIIVEGIERDYPEGGPDWQSLSSIQFIDRRQAWRAIKLILSELDAEAAPAQHALERMILAQPALAWLLLWCVEDAGAPLPDGELRRHVFPLLLAGPAVSLLLTWGRASSVSHFLAEVEPNRSDLVKAWRSYVEGAAGAGAHERGVEGGDVAAGGDTPLDLSRRFADLLRCELNASAPDAGLSVGLARALVKRCGAGAPPPEMALGDADERAFVLTENIGAMAVQAGRLGAGDAARWLRRRFEQWLEVSVCVLVCRHSSSLVTLGAQWAARSHVLTALGPDIIERDRAISLLEQTDIPRSSFLRLRRLFEGHGTGASEAALDDAVRRRLPIEWQKANRRNVHELWNDWLLQHDAMFIERQSVTVEDL